MLVPCSQSLRLEAFESILASFLDANEAPKPRVELEDGLSREPQQLYLAYELRSCNSSDPSGDQGE